MSSTIIDPPAPSASKAGAVQSWPAVLLNPIKRGIARIMERHRRRQDIDILLALDDRMLADIGLDRSEIEYVVRHGRSFLDTRISDDR